MTGENKQQNSGLLGWLLFVVGFAGALFVGWVVFPQLLFSTKYQPINYNHAIQFFISEYVEPGKEVPWFSYTKQTDNVFFSHGAHVTLAEMECTECHRDVEKETEAPAVKINRLTGYPNEIMKMYVCEDCHARENVSNSCDVCHK